jgi:orotidine-5'-phosphate decarboxylase
MTTPFLEKLRQAQRTNASWLCVGLDPDPAYMPTPDALGARGAAALSVFCRAIVAATHDLVCAFKPNLAFFLAYGAAGIAALEETLDAIPEGIPVVLDAKVGDIGHTQRRYGQAAFEAFGVDALTVSPYVGADAVLPLLEAYPGKGLFVLARTSNPDAPRFQEHPGQPPHLVERVAAAAREWSAHGTVGLVVGATYPQDVAHLRRLAPDLPFLIPGVGVQGGSLEAAVRHGPTQDEVGPLINVSRVVLYAYQEAGGIGPLPTPDYAAAARQAAVGLREQINVLSEGGKP